MESNSISGLVVEYIVAIDVTQVRFPADASLCYHRAPALKRRTTMLQPSFRVRRVFAESGKARQHTNENDSEGIRTPAGRAQWISSPSP